jgi:signal transduction histidine kinase
VSNFGPGIPKEFRNKIFQPFSQADSSNERQRGGTGLGLSISRTLIELMGGTIGFESEPDQETVFWFTCPLTDASEILVVA